MIEIKADGRKISFMEYQIGSLIAKGLMIEISTGEYGSKFAVRLLEGGFVCLERYGDDLEDLFRQIEQAEDERRGVQDL